MSEENYTSQNNDNVNYYYTGSGTASNPAYTDIGSILPQEPEVNLKKERKFCSGIGWNFFTFLAVVTAIQYTIAFLVLYFATELYVFHFEIYFLLSMMPIYVIGYPLLAALSKRREAVQLKQNKMGTANFLILLMMCFGVMIVGNIIGMLVNAIIGAVRGTPVVNSLDDVLTGNTLWMNILIVGICAPVFEELMFRKILVGRMVRFGEAAAVVVSGLMFGLFHGNFSQFFYAAFLGMLFAYVYVKTGKIRYPIAIHMIINLSSSLILPVAQIINDSGLESLQSMADPVEIMEFVAGNPELIVAVFIFLIYEVLVYGLGIAGIILLLVKKRKFTFEKGTVTLPKGKRASVVWGNAGMIAFTIGCMVMFVIALIAT